MAKPLEIRLTEAERAELEKTRDNHPKPYMRERCAALLKIAAGESGHQVALHGLYKQRQPDTIYNWVDRYEEAGISGLYIQAGRGRKAGFSPTIPKGE
jgi:transposase